MGKKAGKASGKWILPVLVGLCFASILLMIWALKREPASNSSAFTPPPFEEAALTGTPDGAGEDSQESQAGSGGEKDGQEGQAGSEAEEISGNLLEELGYCELDAQEYRASLCGAPVVRDGKVLLYLTNPESNTIWLKVRILDESGQILGESGLLKPGEYVEAVELTVVPETDTTVELKLMAYEPETYHSAGTAVLSTTLYT